MTFHIHFNQFNVEQNLLNTLTFCLYVLKLNDQLEQEIKNAKCHTNQVVLQTFFKIQLLNQLK